MFIELDKNLKSASISFIITYKEEAVVFSLLKLTSFKYETSAAFHSKVQIKSNIFKHTSILKAKKKIFY